MPLTTLPAVPKAIKYCSLLHTLGLLYLLAASRAWGDTQTVASSPDAATSTAQCVAQGLKGECNSCVCCCYSGSSAFVNYQPTAQCTCGRIFNTGEIKLAVVLAVIVLVPTLFASCYLSGKFWISPYRDSARRQGEEEEAPRSPSPARRCTAAERTSSPLRPRRGVELIARTA